jgi:hypothetical protein
MDMTEQIKAARAKVSQHKFGTPEWEAAMQVVRRLVAEHDAQQPAEEFCSVDSGWHRTRLLDGRVI